MLLQPPPSLLLLLLLPLLLHARVPRIMIILKLRFAPHASQANLLHPQLAAGFLIRDLSCNEHQQHQQQHQQQYDRKQRRLCC
jgi:hypothetical protein